MKAYEEGGLKNPVLEITFGEPDESLSFGKAVFYKYRYNTPVTALSPGRVIVEIPAEYSGSEVKLVICILRRTAAITAGFCGQENGRFPSAQQTVPE